ncbi:hypothetical protein Agub_g1060 [Astrephomene gubernaculifera]|uniref:RNA polymerase I-specific transcription initiation factor RRN3 n=1 Tax=Astrephomene gubernaculifera TaxID=47775 RepID=A0AAD3HH00_9CHLO|nr:hypothetical protein Agub_g1060 [Astrephomene gubernaculifera]
MARSAAGNPELNNYVAEALLTRNQSFEELKSLLRECRIRVEQEPGNEEAAMQLSTLIGAIASNVSAIRERKHETLVSEVLGIKLWNAAPAVLSAVLDFTRTLVVANSAFTHTCLQLIVYSFTPPPGPPKPDDPSQEPLGPWRPSEQALTVHQSLLSSLSRLLGLVPTAPTNMLPLIVAQMPHKLRDRNTQCLYLSALFRIAEDRSGAPIREALLTAVVEHLLSLDVEIKWEDISDVPTGEDEDEDDGANEDIFELEGMLASELDINADPEELAQRQAMLAMRHGGDGRGGWEGAAGGRQHPQQQQQASTCSPVDEMANKMDSMMELAFEHLGKRIAAGELRRLWDTLLSAFERTVLNTHRSKFTQFLLFYTCMHNPTVCPASLIRLLLLRLRDARQPPITRAACAAYLASFLARAAFLSESLVVKTLQELAAFCVNYCNSQTGSFGAASSAASAGPSELSESMPYAGLSSEGEISMTQRHQVLYAAVQAVLYVLCYHMHTIVGSQQQPQPQQQPQAGAHQAASAASATGGNERKQLADSLTAMVRGPVWQVLNHPQLRPLGVCLPSVAAEFVHQASSLGLVDCRPLLSQVEPATRSQRPLEMFFPFDPYLLRRSSRFLQLKKSYVKWRHGHPQSAAAAAAEAEAEAAESSDDEEEEAAADRVESEDGQGEDLSVSSSDEESEDEAGRSVQSDAMLPDPSHRLHAGGGMRPRQPHAAARGIAGIGGGHHHHHHHGRGRGGAALLGTSYMSYASAETASHGDGATSPYGTSPYDAGDMLVQNPLGASPGVVPMSLGTPEMHYISQVPMRIGRR